VKFDLSAIQAELQRRGMDGWLFYDFRQRDPIAYEVLGLELEPGLVTRRWYYFIPAQGIPQKLVHRIESARLDPLPGEKHEYASWEEQQTLLRKLLSQAKKVAMQYSALNAIPYVSLVDAGTVELVRSLGKEVVSSADLVQLFQARWTPEQLESHLVAARRIDDIMQRAFHYIRDRVSAQQRLTEYDLQQWILVQFDLHELVTEDPPIVAVNENSANPHYQPRPLARREIRAGDWVLLDLWAKPKQAHAVYYDITWVGYVGAELPALAQQVFGIVRQARDKAIEFVQQARRTGRAIRGFEVDNVARDVIRAAGYAGYFPHRTGHSIGEQVHSTGANMDNLETHDEREVLPGTCFSIEPGIYLPEFGVRSEVNVYVEEKDARVTGRIQNEIVRILS